MPSFYLQIKPKLKEQLNMAKRNFIKLVQVDKKVTQ